MVIKRADKKGVSDIIATVLIILVTIAAIGILASVIIGFTKSRLNNAGSCINQEGPTIVSDTTCYSTVLSETNVTIRFGKVNASEIYVALEDNKKNSNVYRLKAGMSNDNVNSGNSIELPDLNGGEITYTFNNINAVKASVGIVANNKICDPSDSTDIYECI